MEGGSANDYEYCSGDPVNCNDLDGTKRRKWTSEEQRQVDKIAGECRSGDRYLSPSAYCKGFLKGLAKGDLTAYGFGFVPNRTKKFVRCPSWVKTWSARLGAGDFARAYNEMGYDKGKAANLAAKAAAWYTGEYLVLGARASNYVTAGATAIDAVCTNF